MVITVIALVVLGLNASNQAMNQMSGEVHGPVVDIGWNNHVLRWDWLGRRYDYATNQLEAEVKEICSQICNYLQGLDARFSNNARN